MHLSQLMEFIGHFMGAVLQLILIMMMARRKNKRRGENVFYLLVATVFIWHAGNFVSAFSEILMGRRVIVVGLIWDTATALAMGFVPALLIHALLEFLREAPENFFARRRRAFLIAAYAPLFFFWRVPNRLVEYPELPRAENLLLVAGEFQYWMIAAVALASLM